ncbi:MAG: NAD(P)-binding domain-containing protein [Hyphomicrobiales bacterium]
MQIAIVGAGNVGSPLGTGWRKAGHQVIYPWARQRRDPRAPARRE